MLAYETRIKDIQGSMVTAVTSRESHADVTIPPPTATMPNLGSGTVSAKKIALENAMTGISPTLKIFASSLITNTNMSWVEYKGQDDESYYLLTWTSNSTTAVNRICSASFKWRRSY